MDFTKLKREYIAGNISYRKLAEKHGISFSTLKNVALKEKWHDLKEQAKQKATTKIVEMEADRQAQRMQRLLVVSDKLLEAVEKAVDGFQSEELVFDKSVLKSLSGAIRDIKEIQNIKSSLDIEEQKARIAILNKQAAAEETSSEITVTIKGGLEELSN